MSIPPKKGELRIFRLKTYPTKTVFLTEDTLIETPYQTASGRTNVPVFIYRSVARKDSPFAFAEQDVEALRKECQEVLLSGIQHGTSSGPHPTGHNP